MFKNRFVSYSQVAPPKGIDLNYDIIEEFSVDEPQFDVNDFVIEETISNDPILPEITPLVEEPKAKKETVPLNTNISFELLLDNIGANARITSGYRPGAKTKQGRLSHHAVKGGAYDIVPNDGDFNRLRLILTTHPLSIAWFKANNKGILDETTKEMLARTGGTGAHFHIGPDNAADRSFWKTVEKARSGIKIKKENKGKFTSYCGGNVTNECILKGKNSSNPKIRKRATFAANVRKWHKK